MASAGSGYSASSGSGETIHQKMYPGDEKVILPTTSVAAGGTLTRVLRFSECPSQFELYFTGTSISVEVFAVVHTDVSVASGAAGGGRVNVAVPAKVYKIVFTNGDGLAAQDATATVSSVK